MVVKRIRVFALMIGVVFIRLVVTKDPYILNQIISGNFKDLVGYIKCLVIKL